MRAGVGVGAFVLDWEGGWVFASTAVLVVVWLAMHLTNSPYSDYLTGFCEPLSPLYRCHTSFKTV